MHLLADTHVMEHVEALLTRKSLTARDLRELLPTVWWPAADSTADPRISEAGHAAGVKVAPLLGPAQALPSRWRIRGSQAR